MVPNEADAQRAMTLAQQALEARHKTWLGRSTVRTLVAGHQFQLTQSTLDVLASLSGGKSGTDQTRFLLTSVVHAGVNNLPKDLSARIAQALDSAEAAEPNATSAAPLADWVSPEVAEQARKTGYGNRFETIRAYVPWRVALYSDDGQPLFPTPRPGGPLTATVVGPDGATSASGAGEIHTDRLGRIRIRFDFQAPEAQTQPTHTSDASTWVRVTQRRVGNGTEKPLSVNTSTHLAAQAVCLYLAPHARIPGAALTLGQTTGPGQTTHRKDTRCATS